MGIISCNSPNKLKSVIYFKDPGDSVMASIAKSREPTILPGDRLSILISALNPASAAPYNLPGAGDVASYVVEADGTISFPQLGKLRVAGMQRKELIEMLTKSLNKYLVDPIVNVQLLNFKITVLGEISRPGIISIIEGKATIVDAISLAGDLTIFSKRDNILIIREKDGKREFGNINMLSKDVFNSPYYVLQQNDIVYVEPTREKTSGTEQSFVKTLAIVTSVLSVFSTLLFLIVNVIK